MPHRPQDSPQTEKNHHRTPQDTPKTSPRLPRDPQKVPKKTTRWPQDGPKKVPRAPKRSQDLPRPPKRSPRGPQATPNVSQEVPKRLPKALLENPRRFLHGFKLIKNQPCICNAYDIESQTFLIQLQGQLQSSQPRRLQATSHSLPNQNKNSCYFALHQLILC